MARKEAARGSELRFRNQYVCMSVCVWVIMERASKVSAEKQFYMNVLLYPLARTK